MYASILVLAFSALSSALPLWDPPACPWHPKSFIINQLSIFTPAASNPSPYKSISFKYAVTTTTNNDSSTFSTTCAHSGLEIVNPDYPFQCQNAHYNWAWDGKTLTVGEDYYTACNNVYVLLLYSLDAFLLQVEPKFSTNTAISPISP